MFLLVASMAINLRISFTVNPLGDIALEGTPSIASQSISTPNLVPLINSMALFSHNLLLFLFECKVLQRWHTEKFQAVLSCF